LFRPSLLALFAVSLAVASAGMEARAQGQTKKAPFAAESDQRGGGTRQNQNQKEKPAEKRGWQAAPLLTCSAQPRCTSSPSGRCIAVNHSYKDGTDRGRALQDIVRRCERANRQDSACGCVTQCQSAARCS